MKEFEKELTTLINQHSIENICDIPDYLLAGMVCNYIQYVASITKEVLDWHGCNSICHPQQGLKKEGIKMTLKQKIEEIVEDYKKMIHGSEYDFHRKIQTLREHEESMARASEIITASLLQVFREVKMERVSRKGCSHQFIGVMTVEGYMWCKWCDKWIKILKEAEK